MTDTINHVQPQFDISPMAKLDMLLSIWELLGPREQKILLTLAQRLKNGQQIHGKLEVGKKKWMAEALEEHLDASVYMACQLNDYIDTAYGRSLAAAEDSVRNGTSQKDTDTGIQQPQGPGSGGE